MSSVLKEFNRLLKTGFFYKLRMDRITYEIEWRVEKTHWWFSGRRRLLRSLLSSFRAERQVQILDIGCGVGSNLPLLSSMGFKVTGVDSEMYSLSYAKGNAPGVSLVNGDLRYLPFKANSVGLVLAADILEHLDEDAIGIQEICRILMKGGKVIFTVPAFNFLWGVQDVVGRHKRRYSKRELIRKIETQEFQIVRSSYFNFILFPPILLGRVLIRLFNLRVESENEINLPFINFFLKGLFSLEAYVLRYIPAPLGVSLFCIAEKRGAE